jgi:hypothetical protein
MRNSGNANFRWIVNSMGQAPLKSTVAWPRNRLAKERSQIPKIRMNLNNDRYTLIHVSWLSECEAFTVDFMLNKYYLMINPVPWQFGCLGLSPTSGHIATEAGHFRSCSAPVVIAVSRLVSVVADRLV